MRLDSNNIRNIIYYIIIIEVVQYVRFFFAQKKVPNRQQSRRASQRPTGTLGFFFEPTTRVVESLPLYPEATMLRYVLPCNATRSISPLFLFPHSHFHYLSCPMYSISLYIPACGSTVPTRRPLSRHPGGRGTGPRGQSHLP
jgi:hypothetical protein